MSETVKVRQRDQLVIIVDITGQALDQLRAIDAVVEKIFLLASREILAASYLFDRRVIRLTDFSCRKPSCLDSLDVVDAGLMMVLPPTVVRRRRARGEDYRGHATFIQLAGHAARQQLRATGEASKPRSNDSDLLIEHG